MTKQHATKIHRPVNPPVGWGRAATAAALGLFLVAAASPPAVAAPGDFVTKTVKGSFAKTVTKLKKAITGAKLVIVKEVPFTAMLGMVGTKAEKMKGFEIFHPRYGKVIYNNDKNAFLEAPLRIFVQDQGGKVMIRYRKPSAVFAGYSGLSKLGKDLDGLFAKIVTRTAG